MQLILTVFYFLWISGSCAEAPRELRLDTDKGTGPYCFFFIEPLTTTASSSRLGKELSPVITNRKMWRTPALGWDAGWSQAEGPEQPVPAAPAVCLYCLSPRWGGGGAGTPGYHRTWTIRFNSHLSHQISFAIKRKSSELSPLKDLSARIALVTSLLTGQVIRVRSVCRAIELVFGV